MRKTSVVLSIVVTIILLSSILYLITPPSPPPPSQTQLDNAASYLISMYNRTLGLVANSEDRGPNPTDDPVPCTDTYWVYSDNLWAGYALQPFNREIADNVTDTVQRYIAEYGWPMLFEACIGEPIPMAIHAKKNMKVFDGNVSGIRVQVLLDRHQPQDDPEIFDDAVGYADLCFYMTLNYWIKGNQTESERWFREGELLWNHTTNKGFYDNATKSVGRYQNYKLGLFLLAQRVTEFKSGITEHVEDAAWSYQNDLGGITTQSWLDGSFYGTANAEATSALLLAYNEQLISTLHNTKIIDVGTYYYPWYGEGGINNGRHWNDTAVNTVVDEPLHNSYYDSLNVLHIQQQIGMMNEAGIDFAIISWWGDESYEDNATKVFIEANRNENSSLKFCIMVENYTAFPDFEFIYDYIYDTYVWPHRSTYYTIDDKPVLCWFNEIGEPPKDDARFTDRLVGQNVEGIDWIYYPEEGANRISSDNTITVAPRWDTYYIWVNGGIDSFARHDVNYTEGMYDRGWQYVINNRAKVDRVLVCSWNEYHERTMIEPHIDSSNPDDLLAYSKTRTYIAQLDTRTNENNKG